MTAIDAGGIDLSALPQRERLARLEQWKGDHESRCEERYASIQKTLDKLVWGAFSAAVGLLAWAGVQLWDAQQARLAALEHPQPLPAATRP